MAFHWCDNIHTTVFTPRDYQVELLAAAFERSTMVCLGHNSSKEFITLKLLQESNKHAVGQVSLYLTIRGAQSMHTMIQNLTDLKVYQQKSHTGQSCEPLPTGYQVYLVHPRSFLTALRRGTLHMRQIHLLVLEDCHEVEVYRELLPIFNEFYQTDVVQMPKVLGLAGPLHSAGCSLQELTAMLDTLEKHVHCRAETASDIVTVLRYCSKPIEFVVQCAPFRPDELTTVLEEMINERKKFLFDHRYDPSEIYCTDEFLDELKDIPDPKNEPLEFLNTMLNVLHEMGPWCADRVTVYMLQVLDKQKIKTPHERHYLLLCLVHTMLHIMHSFCEYTFRKCSNHKQLVEQYSSPKVLRLLEVLRLFKPEQHNSQNESMRKISQDLEQMDFQQLSRSLQYSCQSVENISKQQLESRSIIENLDPIIKAPDEAGNRPTYIDKPAYKTENTKHGLNATNFGRKTANGGQTRAKRRPYTRRQTRDNGDGVDTLCAIIFCNHNYTARSLFDLLSEMSRHDPALKFLKCQFTTDRVADPIMEPKEAEIEHRRQEEVLKRFRMHDCNVLIGTAVLEEGIDVPKCNLVVRWDSPMTYRSYVQCKGRARATLAYHVILVAPKFDAQTHVQFQSQTQVSDASHYSTCKLDPGQDDVLDSDSSDCDDESTSQLSKLHNSGLQFTIGSSKGTVKILNPEVITHKPPTSSVISLKEIEYEQKSCESFPLSSSNSGSASSIEQKSSPDETQDSGFSSSKLSTGTPGNECLEVIDLNTVIEELNSTNSRINGKIVPLLCNGRSGPNTFRDPPALEMPPAKPKRHFACLCADIENSLTTTDNFEDNITQMENNTNSIVDQLAQYREIEKMLMRKCANTEPPDPDHQAADEFTRCVAPFKPQPQLLTGASVDLSNSIALVNKYCSKLPSDTFTKLTALWRCATTLRGGTQVFQYTVRLPINSPLKYDIVGLPMSSHILARRMAALQTCIALHKSGELDNSLQPIGKEGFRALEPDWEIFELEDQDERIVLDNTEPRPGTTKRRQYYYKRIAAEFCNCRPVAGASCYLYLLDLTLQCPIPEEQNTRGRKIYPPEDAQQGFGILTLKHIPKVSSFPIFTRSGEVKVSIELAPERIVLTEIQVRSINTFLNYTFTNVLRLQKFLMLFDPDSTENCVFIVPTVKTQAGRVIDWQFLDLIERNVNMMPTTVPEIDRKNLEFDANKYKDAVVMPWYRNQDQPQYFYVAEICPQLSPLSCFPGENYRTFKHYYFLKYGLNIQNSKQPLLDVDHTSARLNFLTPRYVNRKGVALPTSSEETKRAKRENLEQKQILVPELCTVHPFPASLWRTAVCLPCILYRINGLLLADDIRKKVSADIGLGQQEMPPEFDWPMLDFGWSLSEVLRKSRENKLNLAQENSSKNAQQQQNQSKNVHNESMKVELDDEEHLRLPEKSANEIVVEGEKKLQDSNFIEIGTWSNDMADDINLSRSSNDEDEEEFMKYLPSNVSFCDQKMRLGSPTFWDVKEANLINKEPSINDTFTTPNKNRNGFRKNSYAYYDSDDSFASSYDENCINYSSDEEHEDSGAMRISFTSRNEAETIETEQQIEKRNKQMSIIQATNANERNYQQTKNLLLGYNFLELKLGMDALLKSSIAQFVQSTQLLKEEIKQSGMLIKYDQAIALSKKEPINSTNDTEQSKTARELCLQMVPYANMVELQAYLQDSSALQVEDLEKINSRYLHTHINEQFMIVGCGDAFDNFNDKNNLNIPPPAVTVAKSIKLNFEVPQQSPQHPETPPPPCIQSSHTGSGPKPPTFNFDYQPSLIGHPGPSPSIILQALTMSNANDGINLERLETIGDSFLKYAITTYLYITYENVHEGKLSHLRSKQVANLNLYRLGRRKMLGEYMIATKFEPHDNWLPPCYYVPKELEKALIEAKIPPHHWKLVDLPNIKKLSSAEICQMVREKADMLGLDEDDFHYESEDMINGTPINTLDDFCSPTDFSCFIPYNLVTQHSIPDKSVADCVEALIGAYLIDSGPRGALLFMAWLGIRVLPYVRKPYDALEPRIPGTTRPDTSGKVTVFGEWAPPRSPLLHYTPNAKEELEIMLVGFDKFEDSLGYKFRDRSYLLQAMTHASYSPNRLTDCYQRLEFLGDAVLDYLITRHLYEDPLQHSPGALTDLRSALVNNTIFASLAVRHGFHKYFRHLSPGLNEVIDRFVRIQNENGHSISEEYYLLSEEECDDAEDVEVPKALGDVFESIAGAIFLDSSMSLDTVWKVYYNIMKPEIEQFSNSVPKSPIRELLELEPETAKFGKPEKLADGRRVRVTVDVFCKGTFRGIGRNYRIAKCTAAKCALRQLKKQNLMTKKD